MCHQLGQGLGKAKRRGIAISFLTVFGVVLLETIADGGREGVAVTLSFSGFMVSFSSCRRFLSASSKESGQFRASIYINILEDKPARHTQTLPCCCIARLVVTSWLEGVVFKNNVLLFPPKHCLSYCPRDLVYLAVRMSEQARKWPDWGLLYCRDAWFAPFFRPSLKQLILRQGGAPGHVINEQLNAAGHPRLEMRTCSARGCSQM